ncbi:procyclic acidic repetitive family protein [uncultured Corynebacterium sp.]|uniref:procyclic acidic repetitive family protein n=1 Tax=uncultured Corynebacterium sp. TaxID=159447 RepID=UPI0025D645EA|nr:procyclic acidic repetitive family protein [uncultured Corynebacterium sp.]
MTTGAATGTDAALGMLAATAEQTGCPAGQVQQMRATADFTRGLDISALSASALSAGAGGGCTAAGAVDCAAEVAPLVTLAAEAVAGIGGGVPGRGLCEARDALAAHTALWRDAVGSVGSCATAMDQLTVSCMGEISTLVEDVCGLASAAVACGCGETAAGMVQGAVTAVTDLLGQRNSGLEALVDITVGDCLPAAPEAMVAGAAGTTAGLLLGVGAAVALGGSPEMVAGGPAEPPACVEQGPGPEPVCAEPRSESEPGPDPESEPGPEPAPESPRVDPVHGFDKTDRIPDAAGAPTVVADTGGAAMTVDAPVVPDTAVVPPPATDNWNPDIWTTGTGNDTAVPESADAW